MSHAPEPWMSENGVIVAADGKRIPEMYEDACDDEDARRIVACVNGLHGFPTMELERGIVADMKAALVCKDQKLIDLVSDRLRTILAQSGGNTHA